MKKILLIASICAIGTQAQSQSWNVAGNAGTNPSTQFIGTTDGKAFKIRTNNSVRATITSGGKIGIGITSPAFKLDVKGGSINTDSVYRIGGNTVLSLKGTNNTFVGITSGFSNTSGSHNTAIGWNALTSNITGNNNTALGTSALLNNISNNNTAIGFNALYLNGSGYENTALGVEALYFNKGGNNGVALGTFSQRYVNDQAIAWDNTNTSIGYQSLRGSVTAASNTGINNTAVGRQALFSNTSGGENTANGMRALFSNTEGFSNTATGYQALYLNTGGFSNTANGAYALYSNNGSFNTANGIYSLFDNTTGYYNTANGYASLTNNTTGTYNTATGYESLISNTIGTNNTAFGNNALHSNVAGSNATAIGNNAMYYANNSTAPFTNYNVAMGFEALRGSTNAAANTGNNNTATGYQSLWSNTTGNNNTANGYQTLYSNTGGLYNTATGFQALYDNTSGNSNTANGRYALQNNTTGNNNTATGYGSGAFNDNNTACTFIGYDANQTINANFSNSTALGNVSRISGTNQVRVGNTSVTSIGGSEDWTTFSDARIKTNVLENVKGLDFIKMLRPVTYNLDANKLSFLLNEDVRRDEKGNITRMEPDELTRIARTEKAKIVYSGFIAQEVESAAKNINYDFHGVDKPKNEDDLYGLRYAEFVVPLVKAVQELSKNLDFVKSILTDEQKQKLNAISNEKTASLEQNSPNPFNSQTEIKFRLPEKFTSAHLIIYDAAGHELRKVDVKNSSSVNIKASELSAGVYSYSLIIDGLVVNTKQMVLTK